MIAEEQPPALVLANYAGSKDYARLARLARNASIVCIVDYFFRDVGTVRDIGRTQHSTHRGGEVFQVCARGINYIYAFGEGEFATLCEHLNVEFIEPPEVSQ